MAVHALDRSCQSGVGQDSLHVEEVASEMSVSVTDGQGLVVTAWARLEPQGSQPHHGSKLDTMYGEEEGTGGAEASTVTAQTARVSNPPGAADLMIRTRLKPLCGCPGYV